MDTPANISENFVLMDERYKKLENTIKMMQKKHFIRKNTESNVSDIGPNISSIHSDVLDSSCAFSSKLGSEVVSSSVNMRKMMSHKSSNHVNENINDCHNINNNKIATSSVKADDESRIIMPPPKNIGILAHSSRRNSLATGVSINMNFNKKVISSDRERNYSPPHPSTISSIKYLSSVKDSSELIHNNPEDDANTSRISNMPDRIFVQWKVQLNDKGQLIIKGILKDGTKPLRSKPVIGRLSATMVQSCFNHIYELQGRIYDEKNDLPDYIRGKFYNGFPDDWENVYQVWRSFVEGGCRPNFRWPTPVTDSDDDLKSDITELTFRQEKLRSRSKSQLSSQNKSNNYESSKMVSVGASEKSTIKKFPKNYQLPKAQSPIKTIKNQSTLLEIEQYDDENTDDKPNNLLVMEDKSQIEMEKKTNKSSEQNAMNSLFNKIINEQQLNNSAATVQTDVDEDTSNAVFKILTNKHFSIEYIDKVIEMFNCYKYVIMSKPQPGNSSSIIENQTSEAFGSDINHSNSNQNRTPTKLHTNKQNSPKNLHYNQVYMETEEIPSTKMDKTQCDSALVKCPKKLRRKLTSRDYSSNSEISDTDTDYERCRKNVNISYRSSDRRMSANHLPSGKKNRSEMIEKRKMAKQKFDANSSYDSSSETEKNKLIADKNGRIGTIIKNSPRHNTPENHRLRKDLNRQVAVPSNDAEIFKRPIPLSNPHTADKNISNDKSKKRGYQSENVKHPLLHLNKFHQRRGAETPSTITGFLENYDSCVSISEDDRGMTESGRENWPKFNDSGINRSTKLSNSMNKKARPSTINNTDKDYEESCPSFTEDEVQEVNNKKVIKPEPKKLQILQEFNTQSRFQQLLKRDLKNNTGNFVSYKRIDDKISFQDQNQHTKMDQKIYNNEDKRLTLKNDIVHQNSRLDHNKELNFHDHNKENDKTNQAERNTRCNLYENNEEFMIQDSCVNQQVQEEHKNVILNANSLKKEFNKIHDSDRQEKSDNKNKPRIISVEKTTYNLNRFLHRSKIANKKLISKETSQFTNKNSPLKKSNQVETFNSEEPKFAKNLEDDALNSPNQNASIKINDDPLTICKPLSIVAEDIGKTIKNAGIYGSEKNPKQLTNWVPKVVKQSDVKYGLTFEGKLMNEVGHVINKKFTTDFVLRRVTLKIIETMNNEFYQLVGDLNDIKYTVPKELQKLCLNGCPQKIDKFCDKWRDKVLEDIHLEQPDQSILNSTVDIMNIPHSSRGRRRLPPLCYWTGERLTVKDHQTFYNPGNIKDSFSDLPDNSRKDLSHNSSKGTKTSNKNANVSVEKKSTNSNTNSNSNDKDRRHLNSNKKNIQSNQLNNHDKSDEKKMIEDSKLTSKKIVTPEFRSTDTRRSLRERRLLKQQKIDNNCSSSDEEQPPISKKPRRGNGGDENNPRVENKIEKLKNRICTGNNNSNEDKQEIQMRSDTRRKSIRRKRIENNNNNGEVHGIMYNFYRKTSNHHATDDLTNDDLSSI